MDSASQAADKEGREASVAKDLQRSVLARAAQAAAAGRQTVLRGARRAAGGEWVYAALTSIAPPPEPATAPWRVSIGVLLGRHPRTPQLAHKALALLDRFGAVEFGPAGLGFDGERLDWEQIVEVRTRNAFEVMTTEALEHEVDRIREFLPPVPGRKWLVTRAAEAIATVVLAALEHGSTDQRRLDELEVPIEIVHQGLFGRRRVRTGGVFAAASLVVVDQAARSLVATAREHGVPIVSAQPLTVSKPDRAARVGALRARTDAVAELLTRLGLHQAADDGAEPLSASEPHRAATCDDPADAGGAEGTAVPPPDRTGSMPSDPREGWLN